MLAHAFEDLDCRRVEFKTDARNARSRAALSALPAVFEGVLRNHMIAARPRSPTALPAARARAPTCAGAGPRFVTSQSASVSFAMSAGTVSSLMRVS